MPEELPQMPTAAEILAWAAALSADENRNALELTRLFGRLRDARVALKVAEDLAFLLAWERGATLEQLAEPIGQGYKKSAASRRNVLTRKNKRGSVDLVERIRRELSRQQQPEQ